MAGGYGHTLPGGVLRLRTIHRIVSLLAILLPVCIAVLAFVRENSVDRIEDEEMAIRSLRREVAALDMAVAALLAGSGEGPGTWGSLSARLDGPDISGLSDLGAQPRPSGRSDGRGDLGGLRAELDEIRGLLLEGGQAAASGMGFGGGQASPRRIVDRLAAAHARLDGLDARNVGKTLALRERLGTMVLFLLAYSALCAAVVAYVPPRYIFSRLERLSQGLTRAAAGHLSPAVEIVRDDEIGALARTFNAMTGNLAASRTSLMAEIGRRIQAEQELSRREREYRTLVDNLPDIVARFDASGRCLYVNPAVEAVHGFPPERYVGRTVHDLGLSGAVAGQLEEGLARAFAGEENGLEFTDLAWGSSVHYAAVLTPEPSGTGRVETVLAIVRNVTARKEAEILKQLGAEQRTAREAAEAANRAKSEFLARMSHEIRTPMNGIMGMTELAMAEPAPPQVRSYLGLVRQSAESLLSIINDILDLSKIEAGRMELEESGFDLRAMVETALKPLAVIAGDKGVRLFFEVERDLPRLVLGDQGRLRQVLVNLVGNAVKFTSRGRVSVLVASSQSMPGNAPCHRRIPPEGRIRLLFSVSDTGSGIPADDLDSIFDSFAQAAPRPAGSPGPSGRQEGTGLGLAIARQLVEMMGGQIKVESQEGKGSIFSFSIELGIAEPAEAGAPAEDPADVPTDPAGRSCSLADRGPLTILLVEDDAVNRLLASELLARRGHRVDAAGTGREALEALAARRYDLVLMDVRMPEMSGEEATRLIRSGRAPGVDRSVPIVALTAHALKGDRERFLAAGMDDYLSKPIDLDRLDRVLDRLSASTRPAGG